MRSKASGLALVVVAGLVAGCASSGYQPEVDWPAGWQVITESIPPEASDVEQLGSRQLATKLGPGGEKEASIELLSLKMMEEESVEIDGQFQSVFDVVQSGYRKAGLGSRCTTPIRSNLGGLASLETHCRISQGNEVLLTQIVAMALGQRAMYPGIYRQSGQQRGLPAELPAHPGQPGPALKGQPLDAWTRPESLRLPRAAPRR